MNIRSIELLSPAKDLNCAIEAINHGADAVYIGAPKFGARSAAGNTVADIEALCRYAHLYYAKVYVALNTLLKDDELSEAEALVWELYHAGVDALIVQDMALTQLNLPPIPLHASTQTDNRTAEKVAFLEAAGFTQVVLARELSLTEIKEIADKTTVALEAFVHGALCVSYSGQCFLSAALCGRSANRGECAQYCRLPYKMTDANGEVIADNKHLLSLKDMNRSDSLEDMIDAGISSFKIEGRLKDISYVKNITAYYRKKLDAIIDRRPDLCRTSTGNSKINFEPIPEKSFNRGFTNYFLDKRTNDITSFDSPKSKGEPVGTVKEIKGNSFTVAGIKKLNNGDGLAFINSKGELEGFRANRVEENRVFPLDMPSVKPKTPLFRNYDQAFEQLMSKPTADRRIRVAIEFIDNPFGFTLCMTDESGARVMTTEPFNKEIAKREQEENIRTQLAKLGNTPFEAASVSVNMDDNWFVPSSLLSEMRRKAVERLIANRATRYPREVVKKQETNTHKQLLGEDKLTYLGNVLNAKAKEFYIARGVKEVDSAFEAAPQSNVPLMFAKHCLRYSMGWCPKQHKDKSPYKEPFFLNYKDIKLRLEFECKSCQMLVYANTDI